MTQAVSQPGARHVVIGSGAGGATTARLLAEAGEEVLVIEEGPRLSSADFAGSKIDLMGTLYRDGGVTPIFGRPNIAFGEGCCVGGSTVINGALLWRPPADLLARWESQYGLAGLGSAEMDARLAWLERELAVSVQPERDVNRASWLLADAAAQLGWRSELAPRGQRGCRNSNRCPTGCPTGAKQSMLVSFLPAAEKAGARIVSGIEALRLVVRHGRAVAVEASKGGQTVRIDGEFFWVCGGPMQSPRLLAASGIKAGAGLGLHLNLKVVARFDHDLAPHQGTIMAVQVKEHADRGILLGGSNFDPVYLAATLASHGTEVVERVAADWCRSSIFVAQFKASGRGSVGRMPFADRPLPRYSLTGDDIATARLALERMAELLFAAGARELFLPIVGSPPVHNLDTARQIAGAATAARLDVLSVHALASCHSALDSSGRVRGLANVVVNDASMLPEAPGINPQLTIMAMAGRNVQRHLESAS